MSPLYGAAFLWLVAAILWWSGWREETTENLPGWAAGLFLAVWPLAWLGKVTIADDLSVNGAWVWTLFSAVLAGARMPAARRWTSASGGLLIGSVAILAGRLIFIPSGFEPDGSSWAIAALIGLLAGLLLRSASEQAVAVSVCLVINEVAHVLLRAQADTLPAGAPDEGLQAWWIAILCARLWTTFAKAAGEQGRKWAVRSGGRRGGQRS